MNIHNKSSLAGFWKKHADCKEVLELWYDDVSELEWMKPNDVKKAYVSASIIKNDRVVFNMKGNKYRLIVEMNYTKGWAFVKFIGTHTEYDKVNAETVDLYKAKRK